MTPETDEARAAIDNGGEPLLSLCLKEADAFSAFLERWSRESTEKGADAYRDGLTDWEKKAVAGYIYQKSRGRF